MRLENLMNPPIVVDKDQRLTHAISLLKKHKISRLLVMEHKRLCGIITEKDILKKVGLLAKDLKVSSYHISSCTTQDPFVLKSSDKVKKAVKLFRKKKISGIPIFNGKLIGIVTKVDVIGNFKFDGVVSECMERDFKVIAGDDRVIHARKLLLESRSLLLPVMDEILVGVVTAKDVLYGLTEFRKKIDKHMNSLVKNFLVYEIMSRDVKTTTPDEELEDAKKVMLENKFSGLPVVEDGEVVGILTKDTLIDYVSRKL